MTFYYLEKEEAKDLGYIILALSFMFALLSSRFSDLYFFESFIYFIIFLSFLFLTRLLFMKFIAFRIGFKLTLHQTYFSKWGFKKYENVKAFSKDMLKTSKIRGISSTILSLFLYAITFGFLIFPSLWRYKTDKIPHMFLGTRHKFEYGFMHNVSISNLRIMKVLFMGYLYYFIFAILIKILLPMQGVFLWFYFALFWIAFLTLIPLIGTEGYELYIRNRFAFISAITILFLGMLSIFIFSEVSSIVLVSLPIISLTLAIVYYKKFL